MSDNTLIDVKDTKTESSLSKATPDNVKTSTH